MELSNAIIRVGYDVKKVTNQFYVTDYPNKEIMIKILKNIKILNLINSIINKRIRYIFVKWSWVYE